METDEIIIRRATERDSRYATEISNETRRSGLIRGIGISERPASIIAAKIKEGQAVIAVLPGGKWVGFIYYQPYQDGRFISQSGLIVSPEFRRQNVAVRLKAVLFNLCRQRYPAAALFSISSSTPIMKMNTALGFEAVGYDQLPAGSSFWEGCKGCVKHNILVQNDFKHCLCTAMLFTQAENSAGKKDMSNRKQLSVLA